MQMALLCKHHKIKTSIFKHEVLIIIMEDNARHKKQESMRKEIIQNQDSDAKRNNNNVINKLFKLIYWRRVNYRVNS